MDLWEQRHLLAEFFLLGLGGLTKTWFLASKTNLLCVGRWFFGLRLWF